jgi:hypothetical protein
MREYINMYKKMAVESLETKFKRKLKNVMMWKEK